MLRIRRVVRAWKLCVDCACALSCCCCCCLWSSKAQSPRQQQQQQRQQQQHVAEVNKLLCLLALLLVGQLSSWRTCWVWVCLCVSEYVCVPFGNNCAAIVRAATLCVWLRCGAIAQNLWQLKQLLFALVSVSVSISAVVSVSVSATVAALTRISFCFWTFVRAFVCLLCRLPLINIYTFIAPTHSPSRPPPAHFHSPSGTSCARFSIHIICRNK